MSGGMSLEAYVRETLLSIAKAVKESQNDKDLGDLIGRVPHATHDVDESRNYITEVKFDVATTVEEAGSTSGGGNIKVPALGGLGAQGRSEHSNSHVSRVSFQVPIAIPRPQAQRAEDEQRDQEQRARKARASDSIARRTNVGII